MMCVIKVKHETPEINLQLSQSLLLFPTIFCRVISGSGNELSLLIVLQFTVRSHTEHYTFSAH